MNPITRRTFFLRTTGLLLSAAATCPIIAEATGLKQATILIIRHAEKPDDGEGLAPAGEARAKAYVEYFKNFQLHSEPLKLDAIFAAADSRESHRPRLTVEPLAQAIGLAVNASYKNKDFQALATELKTHHEGKHILICWHHGEMSALLQALGADPNALLPGGRWPGDKYDWVIELRYDHEGNLKDARRIDEGI